MMHCIVNITLVYWYLFSVKQNSRASIGRADIFSRYKYGNVMMAGISFFLRIFQSLPSKNNFQFVPQNLEDLHFLWNMKNIPAKVH